MVGRVVSEQGLQEDPGDPDGYTAWNTRIEVLESLKASAPRLLLVRSENTSSRYAMGTGEQQVLFLTRDGDIFSVDSCGNSAARMPDRRLEPRIRRLVRAAGQPGK